MNVEEFRRLAEAWGGDIERWPEQTPAAARQYAVTTEGEGILREAWALDGLLVAADPVSEERAVKATFGVLQRIAAEGPSQIWIQALVPNWRVASASLACSIVIGALLAAALPYRVASHQREAAQMLSMIIDNSSASALW